VSHSRGLGRVDTWTNPALTVDPMDIIPTANSAAMTAATNRIPRPPPQTPASGLDHHPASTTRDRTTKRSKRLPSMGP
jgi:hypothetical protein